MVKLTFTIVVLNQEEEFLRFLDPELCDIEETIETGGLRTIKLDYKFQDLNHDKNLFKLGNKLWIQGDENLTDCLYVINTTVKEDIYDKNSITLELEEVLVELNYTPFIAQNEITTNNGFNTVTTNGKHELIIDWNALNYFFGKYFNIGVVQDCLSPEAQKVTVTGTVNRMNLLRSIEEETGNVFVTRYEKDVLDNTIHRYLDFLNPINVSKNWELNLEYQFIENDPTVYTYDSNGNLTTDTYDDVKEQDDIVPVDPYTPVPNMTPSDVSFRVVDMYGNPIPGLEWSATDLGLTNTNQLAVISLSRDHDVLAVDVGDISFATYPDDEPYNIIPVKLPGFEGEETVIDEMVSKTDPVKIGLDWTETVDFRIDFGEEYDPNAYYIEAYDTDLFMVDDFTGEYLPYELPENTSNIEIYYPVFTKAASYTTSNREYDVLYKIKIGDTLETYELNTFFNDEEEETSVLGRNKLYKVFESETSTITNFEYTYLSEPVYVEPLGNGIINISRDPTHEQDYIVPDDAWFQFYDTLHGKVLFQTRINHQIGTVHEEILDFGFNLDNITYEIDETDTYQAITPILTSEGDNGLTRSEMNQLITDWKNLNVNKGDLVPMIVQKTNVKTSTGTLEAAEQSLGEYNISSNYYERPYNPNDNTSSTNAADKTFEFMKAIAYWRAPFTKHKGKTYIETDTVNTVQYTDVICRTDERNRRGLQYHPKIGTVETSDENVYSIFNDVCMKLKDKQYPEVTVEVDVANLRRGEFNPYNLHDKVYVKIPDSQELLVARVTKTKKEAHDVAKNTIEITNYTVNTVKTLQHETVINASNMSFPYPNTETLIIQLENADYDELDEFSVHYPANKLINIAVFKEGEFRKNYTKKTDIYGYCYLPVSLKPGDYEFQITYGGDEEYLDTSLTIQVNISGTLETVEVEERASTSKTTSTTSTNTKTVTTYYDKYGRSPDKKTILAIGRISAGGDTGSYANFYVTEFKNKCPHCGSTELYWSIFWAGNETSNWGKFPATGRQEGGSAEGHIFCKKCDADYSCQGNEHVSGGRKLTVTKATKKSSKADAYTLKKGKYKYGTKTEVVKTKSTNTQTRKNISSGMNSTVKNKALSIVGNSTGVAAAKKIAEWVKSNVKYKYYTNFHNSPKTVLSTKLGNCCDQTRLMLTLMDAAGCRETLTLKYTLVCCGSQGVGHCFGVIVDKKTGKKTYADPCYTRGGPCWGHYISGYGSPPGRQHDYVYNKQPF